MKHSRYNIFLPTGHTVGIVYNSLTDKFIFLKKGVWERMRANEMPDDKLACWSNLIAGGFVVPNGLDELDVYKERTRRIEADRSNAHLIINPTVDCNFRCWYCYEKHVASKMSMAMMERVLRLIDKLCNETNSITISFFGGEPLLCYKDVMLPIVRYAHGRATQSGVKFSFNCTTNGSLLTTERINELKKYNFNFAQITLDGNEKLHNKTRCFANGLGSYGIIVNNIKELAVNQIKVTLRINYTNENIRGVGEIPNSFLDLNESAKKNIEVSFHRVWQENPVPPSDVNAAIKSFGESGFTAAEMILGQYCYGDLRSSLVVNYNGDVYKCTAVDFERSPRDGYLNLDGDIIWENDALEKRMSSKFTNKPCLDCAIFPICHGGCSSRSLENKDRYCILGFDESRKIDMVREKLIYNIKYIWKNNGTHKY